MSTKFLSSNSHMSRREFFGLSAGATAAVFLAGCSSGESNSGLSSQETSSGESSLAPIVLVTAGTGEPYSLMHDDKTWTGIDPEIWEEIKKRSGVEWQVKQAAFDSLWGELDTARADVSANCFAVKKERAEKYLVSIPYYGDAQSIIVNDSTSYKTVADLKGKVLGCTNGQASQTIVENLANENGFEVKLYEDSAVGMNDLMLERIDAYANTNTNINNFMHNNDQAKFRYFDEQLTANNVAYFFPKTERGQKIKDFTDKYLQEMLDDGTIAKITEKWMYADMTKLIQEDNVAG